MNRVNLIQQKIKELSGGEYQKLCDRYLVLKYGYDIHPYGVEECTNKPTRGTPDSYVRLKNDKYVLIMYGSVKKNTYKKLGNYIECYTK